MLVLHDYTIEQDYPLDASDYDDLIDKLHVDPEDDNDVYITWLDASIENWSEIETIVDVLKGPNDDIFASDWDSDHRLTILVPYISPLETADLVTKGNALAESVSAYLQLYFIVDDNEELPEEFDHQKSQHIVTTAYRSNRHLQERLIKQSDKPDVSDTLIVYATKNLAHKLAPDLMKGINFRKGHASTPFDLTVNIGADAQIPSYIEQIVYVTSTVDDQTKHDLEVLSQKTSCPITLSLQLI